MRIFLAFLACVAAGAALAELSEYEVKAGFIYNFAKLTDWPDGALPAAAPMKLCILGDDPFGPAKAVLDGKLVDQHPLEVRRVAAPAELKACQIAFLPASQAASARAVADLLRDSPVLTIADSEGLAARGLVIGFYRDEERIRFEINVDAAKRAHLAVSSRLLNLARIVHDADTRP